MGVKERRERQKETLRQDILDAARELFVREGYDNVTMRRVAEKIEYSPTTIYLYFRDKADLLFALCQESFAKLVKEFEALGRDTGDPVVALKKGLRTYIQFGLKHPHHYLATFSIPHEQATPEETARHRSEESMGMKAFDYLRTCVGECVRQGTFRVDVEVASRALWAAIHGVTSLMIVHPEFPWGHRQQVIDLVVDSMVEGLRARG